MDSRLLAFIGVAALLTIAPGPDMALVLRNALRGGRPTVAPTAAGICSGLIVWGGVSSLGVAALLATSAQLYQGLKLAGALYLVVLGGVFYATLLPQFILPGQPVFATSVMLACIHASLSLAWLTIYGYGASRLADLLSSGRVRQALEAATGTVLVAFGL